MGEKPLNERKTMSQSKEELILKCSFNQRDCDIEKFKKNKLLKKNISEISNKYLTRHMEIAIHLIGIEAQL